MAQLKRFNTSTGTWEAVESGAISDGTNTITPNEIGILSGLNTTEKGSLVGAVNEVVTEMAGKADFRDVFSAYYARKNQEYLGMVSRKLRYGENVAITFYGDSNSMRSNSLYQTTMLNALNGVYGNRISRIDRAYPGDSAEMGYGRWTSTHAGDISIICFGTNDSTSDDLYGYPESTKVKDYIYWIEKLITRELDWGKAVIIVSPIPVRNDKRWETKVQTVVTDPWTNHFRADAYVFGNICEWLSEKYSAPFVDSREIIANYEDEIFADSNGNSLGTATAAFGDPVHLIDEGLQIWGGRVAGIFIGDSLLRKQKAIDGTAFATRKGEDPFTTSANIFDPVAKRIQYYTPYAWAVGDNSVNKNRALELHPNEEITYSFYCDSEDLFVYANMYVFPNSQVQFKLDYGFRQPLSTLDEELKNGANYGFVGNPSITYNSASSPIICISRGQIPATKVAGATYTWDGIRISSRGWHTINIRVVSGYVAVSGLRFRSQLIEKIDNSLTIQDLNSVDLNTVVKTGTYYTFGTNTNQPTTENGLLKHYEKTPDNSIALQEFYPNGAVSKQWMRLKITGTWQAWTQIK